MPSPFPGMDPWLEYPARWGNVHAQLVVDIRVALNRLVRPKYLATVEERLFLVPNDDPTLTWQRVADVRVERTRGRHPKPKGGTAVRAKPVVLPTVSVDPERQTYVEVRDAGTQRVVTVVEVLSPSNKRAGAEGRKQYLTKHQQVTASDVHLVEIDLLRAGERHPWQAMLDPHDYLCHVSPAWDRPAGLVWPVEVREPLPAVLIPLAGKDRVDLDLQAVFAESYDRGSWDGAADYRRPPVPPLPPELDAWADALLRERGLR